MAPNAGWINVKTSFNSLCQAFRDTFLSRATTASFWMLLSMMAQLGLEKAFLIPYLSHILSRAEFGSFILARAISTLTAAFLANPISNILLREHAGESAGEKNTLWRTGVLINFVLSAVVAAGMYCSAPWIGGVFHDAVTGRLVRGFAAYSLVFSINTVLLSVYYMRVKILKMAAFQALAGVAYLLAIPFARMAGVQGVAWGYFTGTVFETLLLLFLLRNELFTSPLLSNARAFTILRDMWALVAGMVFLTSMQWADRLVLGHYAMTSEVAFYYISTSIAYVILLPFEAISGALLGIVSEKKGPHEIRPRTRRRMRILIFVVSPLSVLVVGRLSGPWVMDLLYGRGSFERGKLYFEIMLVGVAFSAIYSVARSFVVIFRKVSISFYLAFISCVINLISNIILGKYCGAIGVVIATAGTQIIRGMLYLGASKGILSGGPVPQESQLAPLPLE